MGRTLLVHSGRENWRAWQKEHAPDQDLLILDPANSDFAAPTRCLLVQQGKVVQTWFTGAIQASRNPLAILVGMSRLMPLAGKDLIVVAPPVALSPISKQILLGIAHQTTWVEIQIPAGHESREWPWPIGPEEMEWEEGVPPLVRTAQRQSRWLELLENSNIHEIWLDQVRIEGVRLGSGQVVKGELDDAICEVSGGVLLVVTDHQLRDQDVSVAMDHAHANRSILVRPSKYEGLICCLALESGEEIGLGRIQSFDMQKRLIKVASPAVVPAPVKVLKIGALRVEENGKESETQAPWTV